MQHQPSLFSSDPGADPAAGPHTRPNQGGCTGAKGQLARSAQPASPWLRQMELWVRIIVQLYVGALIVALPWLRFWSENSLFTYNSTVATLASSGFVRGAVSGLGLLNIYLGLSEAFGSRRT